jgi:tetratricopeptide (TPR) repeat protein
MPRSIRLAIAFALVAMPAVAAPRVAFTRTIAPKHDLGGEQAAIIYALGDNDKVATFIDVFLEHTNRSGVIRIDEVFDRFRHLAGEKPSEATIRQLSKEHPADVYLGVTHFTCNSDTRGGEGSTRDPDGARIKRRHLWVDALCRGRVDVIQPATAKRLFSFEVKGEGTSPRVADVTDEERGIAYEQAARYAALEASEAITPRRVRESIELDESSPEFADVIPLVDAERVSDARAHFENQLKRSPDSAALHYNIAATCEALGDVDCAHRHYRDAVQMAPNDPRYRSAFRMFRRRNAIK